MSMHVIVVAPPLQGHINPSVQLTLNLASKGFIVTFINTHAIHHLITKAKNKTNIPNLFATSGFDNIRYRTVYDGFPLSFDRSLHRESFMMAQVHVVPAHVEDIVAQLMAEPSGPRPSCLVADTFVAYAHDISKKFGLAFVSLWTQPALVLSLYSHVDMLNENGHASCGDKHEDAVIDYLPGVKPLQVRDLVSLLRETDTTTALHKLIDKAFSDVKKADFILCNTVEELEPDTISALKEIRPVYSIGPLLPSDFTNPSVEMDLIPQSDCTLWLDSKPPGSVLYASFGSFAHSSKRDIAEIANGLLLSGLDFIWVLRPDVVSSDVTDVLPEGFLESAGGRGLVVPWCRQNAVLSHSSVGGFLTHCGWNSILESVWMGVPMVCFPLFGDQFPNRKLVVDDWRVGIDLVSPGKVVSCDEVAERTSMLMRGETCDKLRANIGRARKMLENALLGNGSSRLNFDKFVEDLEDQINTRRGGNNQKL